MLTFFERSPLDQVLRNDKVHRIQPCFQSPIKISGTCLAVCCNTDVVQLQPSCHDDRILHSVPFFFRNHAVQWILSGQHGNHRV